MLHQRSFCYIAGALLSLFLQNTIAQTLSPIRNDPPAHEVRAALDRRGVTTLLDLQNVETFLWGGADNSSAALGNLTVYTPAEYEHIINMEKFYPLLTSLSCDEQGMTIAFKDDATFEKAKEAWDWANGADNRSFVMVTGMGDCGWNKQRQPYVVRNLQYDEDKNVARLVGEPKEWKEIAQSYDLVVGNIPGSDAWLAQRDLSKTISVPLALSFPFALELGAEGISSKLECSDCSLSGQFNIELRISMWLAIPTGASIRMSPASVKAIAKLEWSLAGELTKDFEKKWTPATFPTPASIVIPHVVEIGPVIDLIVGVALKALKAQATVSGGATASLPDSAIVELNLLNPTENKFSGWLPEVHPLPFQVDARISAGLETYFATALDLKAEALGHGFQIGLKLKLPYFTGNFEYIVSQTGVCDSKKSMGVKASLNIGGALSIEAKEVSSDHDLLDINLGSKEFPILDPCWTFGPDIGAPAPTNAPAPSPKPSGNPGTPGAPGTPGTPGSPDTCKVNSGASGQCISTSDCAAAGGKSEAGHCPGAANIQCCVKPGTPPPPPPTGGDCKINSGAAGTCISTSACAGKGGNPEAGHCPGPADIQCCVITPAPAQSTCKFNSGTPGTCMSTSTCASQGGKSEAGHCPGAADIQCCAPATCKVNSGESGTCIPTGTCAGQGRKNEAGHCPGGVDIQCCYQPSATTLKTKPTPI